MVYGVLRLINFANSEVFMIGTFATLFIEIHVLGYAASSPSLHGAKLVWTLILVFIGSMIASKVANSKLALVIILLQVKAIKICPQV